MKYTGRVVLVTGVAQGIGRGIALRFADEGASLVLCDVSDKVNEVADTIRREGGRAVSFAVDVTQPADVGEMVSTVIDEYGRIDALINNAGIFPTRSFLEMSYADWDAVLRVNLDGTFICSKAVVPHMLKNKSGVIVNISSVAAIRGYANLVHYSSSKAAVIGFTKSLASELAPSGIRVNAVAPGLIRTPGTESLGEKALEQIVRETPLNRLGTVDDVASVVVFLCSDDAGFITGQTFIVDGGWATL